MTEATKQTEAEFVGEGDTYWIAETYVSDEGVQSLLPKEWMMDLLIRVDGTARFRDVREAVSLTDDSTQYLIWEKTEEGHILFYSSLHTLPVLDAVCEDGILTVTYMTMTVTMGQRQIPDTVGEDLIPAELVGTWLMVSGETEGYQWEAMPGELASLVLRVAYQDGLLTLMANMEDRDHYGYCNDFYYDLAGEVLQEPVYEGCGNETWCVRLGVESPRDENGYPTETEFYITLLDYNTLLMQRYYTMDGYPAVSYQTYARFPDLVSWRNGEALELDYTNWDCVGYTALSGEQQPIPAELEGLNIALNEDQVCYIRYADGRCESGTWLLAHGGVVLLQGQEDEFWFGGAVSIYGIESEGETTDAYQLSLYYNGGILKLVLGSYG